MRYSNPPSLLPYFFLLIEQLKCRGAMLRISGRLCLGCVNVANGLRLARFFTGITVILFFSSFLAVNVSCTRSAKNRNCTLPVTSPNIHLSRKATREWWSLLTVGPNWGEWGLREYKWKGVLSWLVRWACRASTRDFFPALAGLVGPVQNTFSSPFTFLISLSPSPSKLGRQPCWVACLLVCVSVLIQHVRHCPPPIRPTWAELSTCLHSTFLLCAGFFEQSMGGIGLSYRPARLHRLAESIPWNWFLGLLNFEKYRLWFNHQTSFVPTFSWGLLSYCSFWFSHYNMPEKNMVSISNYHCLKTSLLINPYIASYLSPFSHCPTGNCHFPRWWKFIQKSPQNRKFFWFRV